MNNRKNTIIALLIVLAVAVVVYAMWVVVSRRVNAPQSEGVVCTADAIQCPDGSWVGRSGPNCYFVCPLGTSTPTTSKETLLQAVIGQEVSGLDVKIVPNEVVEDSRCPYDVQCVQAGTVRVRATVTSGLGTSTPVFTLGTPFTTEVETITLISVTPTKESGKTIASTDYRLTFKVTKR